jgi:apolipoprotein N-acyltransferase
VAALAAGALLPLAFAPWGLFPLAVLCPALLFRLWLRAEPGPAFRLGLLFGLGYFGFGVGWLHISISRFGGVNLALAVAATAVIVFILALYPAAIGWCVRRYRPRSAALALTGVFPAAWVLGEWLRGLLFSGFPWLQLGYSQVDSPLGAFAPLQGVLGVGWVVCILAGLVVLIGTGHPLWRRGVVAVLAIALAAFAVDRIRWTAANGAPLEVALVQGSVPLELKWRDGLRQFSVDRYVGLSADHWQADIVVWPETAIPAFRHDVAELYEALAQRAAQGGVDFYTGVPIRDAADGRYYNSVELLGAAGGVYQKRHLVPFGEYLPYKNLLGRVFAFLDIPMSDFSAGDGSAPPLLAGRHAMVGVSICYEDVFGAEIRRAVPQAELLINVSNDAWFGNSAAPHQHLEIARLRARETGRWLLRATNSGISAVIDERGGLRAQTGLFDPTVLTAGAERRSGLTPYGRFGDVALLLLCVALCAASCRRRQDAAAVQ